MRGVEKAEVKVLRVDDRAGQKRFNLFSTSFRRHKQHQHEAASGLCRCGGPSSRLPPPSSGMS